MVEGVAGFLAGYLVRHRKSSFGRRPVRPTSVGALLCPPNPQYGCPVVLTATGCKKLMFFPVAAPLPILQLPFASLTSLPRTSRSYDMAFCRSKKYNYVFMKTIKNNCVFFKPPNATDRKTIQINYSIKIG
jgi:hypothetical protein